jgi:DNA-binding XRE family transcriptional regulator
MASILGLKTSSAYYKKENGSINFSLEEAGKIAKYFNIAIEDVFLNK